MSNIDPKNNIQSTDGTEQTESELIHNPKGSVCNDKPSERDELDEWYPDSSI